MMVNQALSDIKVVCNLIMVQIIGLPGVFPLIIRISSSPSAHPCQSLPYTASSNSFPSWFPL